VSDTPYRTPAVVETDEERYKRAHTAYWAMMALDQKAFNALPPERQREYRGETERLRGILTELGPKLRRWALPNIYAAPKRED
jgi:hypothetical protein